MRNGEMLRLVRTYGRKERPPHRMVPTYRSATLKQTRISLDRRHPHMVIFLKTWTPRKRQMSF